MATNPGDKKKKKMPRQRTDLPFLFFAKKHGGLVSAGVLHALPYRRCLRGAAVDAAGRASGVRTSGRAATKEAGRSCGSAAHTRC